MATRFLEVPLKEPSYLTLAPYERDFPLTYWRKVFGEYWQISAYTSTIYVLLVFGGRWLMRNRAPFKLNGILTVWNIALAAMSIYAFSRVAPEFFRVLLGKNGFHNSVCEWYAKNQLTYAATLFISFILLYFSSTSCGTWYSTSLWNSIQLTCHHYHKLCPPLSLEHVS